MIEALALKRNAAEASPEELALQEALMLGQRAGMLNIAAGANPFPIESPKYGEWERGRAATRARYDARILELRSLYRCQHCVCAGRGQCRDAA